MSEETKVTDSTCSVTMEEEWKDEMEDKFISGRVSPTFITIENEKGLLEQVQVNLDEDDFTEANGSYFNYGAFGDQDSKDDNMLSRNGSIPNTKFIKDYKKNSKRRIISKSGDCNTQLYRVSSKKRRFIKDVFTTMVDMRWRYTLLAFVASFLISWLLFAVVWWLISYIHGDYLLENINDPTFTPCILANKNFASAFLFSQETQHTIGYGSRQTTEECPENIIVQCVQSIVGVIIQAVMAGVVFAKLARPKARTKTVVFSKSAVITQRNGRMFFLFRVANMRSSHLLEAHVRAQLIRKVTTEEGENIFFHQQELNVGTQLDGSEDRALVLWPVTVVHLIDQTSPFWKMSPKDLLNSNFEIVVTLEGSIESTGSTTQARSSYLPNEVLWGFRFDNLVSYAKQQGVYAIDCSAINKVLPDNTPRMSAYRMEEIKKKKASSVSYSSHRAHHLSLPGLNQLSAQARKVSSQSYKTLPTAPLSRQRLSVPASISFGSDSMGPRQVEHEGVDGQDEELDVRAQDTHKKGEEYDHPHNL